MYSHLFESISGLFTKTIVLERNAFLAPSKDVYWVANGSLRMYVQDNGEERNIRFGYKEDFVVFLDTFLAGRPSEFQIQAIKQTELRILPHKAFRELIDSSEGYRSLWNSILQDLVLQQLEREKDLLTSSPKTRYERVLHRSPRVFQEIPHKHIANYLRMTPETLCRLKKS